MKLQRILLSVIFSALLASCMVDSIDTVKFSANDFWRNLAVGEKRIYLDQLISKGASMSEFDSETKTLLVYQVVKDTLADDLKAKILQVKGVQ